MLIDPYNAFPRQCRTELLIVIDGMGCYGTANLAFNCD